MRRIVNIGLISALAMVIFKSISLCVQYEYVKTEYYVGLVAICFGVAGYYMSGPDHIAGQLKPIDLLSSKEMTVLGLILDGKTNKEIAANQFIELSTVKTHINHIYAKLGVTNRKEVRLKYGAGCR